MTYAIRTVHVDTEMGRRGGEQQMMYLISGLLGRGHQAACVCRPGSRVAEWCDEEGVECFRIDMRSELDIPSAVKLRGVVRRLGAQIVHAHTAHGHAVAAMAALGLSGCRCIVSRRVDFALRTNPLSRLKYRLGVDRYIAISEAVKGIMTGGGVAAERVSIAHSGIDLGRFDVPLNANLRGELGIPATAKIIGNIAALVDHKGHRFLLDAVPDVLRRFPDAWFVIAGDGELGDALKQQADDLDVADRVLFLGYRRDVPSLLNLFDVFVMSSHLEGLCTSLLDAMAMELPIVATDAGGIPEIVKHEVNGLIAPAGKPRPLADAVVRLLEDEDLSARLAAEGRKIVERDFSADAMVEKTLSIYRELLE